MWMETMFLVAGLAVAGLAGILAAFYFSIRSGNRGGKRLRPAGAGRPGAGRATASRAGAARRPAGQAVRSGQTEFALRASGPARTGGSGRLAGARASTLAGDRTAGRRFGERPERPEEAWPGVPANDDPFPTDSWPIDPPPGDPWAGDPPTDPRLRAAKPGAVKPGA